MEGPVEIDKYVMEIMNNFVQADGYSEVTFNQLKLSIKKYLISDYNKSVVALSAILENEQRQGLPINRDWYQNEVQKIRTKLKLKVEEIGWMGN